MRQLFLATVLDKGFNYCNLKPFLFLRGQSFSEITIGRQFFKDNNLRNGDLFMIYRDGASYYPFPLFISNTAAPTKNSADFAFLGAIQSVQLHTDPVTHVTSGTARVTPRYSIFGYVPFHAQVMPLNIGSFVNQKAWVEKGYAGRQVFIVYKSSWYRAMFFD